VQAVVKQPDHFLLVFFDREAVEMAVEIDKLSSFRSCIDKGVTRIDRNVEYPEILQWCGSDEYRITAAVLCETAYEYCIVNGLNG
jgi:hypothetical protein